MANVERLINGSAFSPAQEGQQPGGAGPSSATLQIDPEVMKELEAFDQPPPKLEELQNLLNVTNYNLSDESSEEMEQGTPEEPSQEDTAGEENNVFEPQFRDIPTIETEAAAPEPEAPSAPEETAPIDLTGFGPAEESVPEGGGQTEELSDLLSQLSANPESDVSLPSEILPEETGIQGFPEEAAQIETPVSAEEFAFPSEEQPGIPSEPAPEMEFPDLGDFSQIESKTPSGMEPAMEMPESGNLEIPEFEIPSKDELMETPSDAETARAAAKSEFSDIEDHIKTFETPKAFEAPEILKSKKQQQTAFGMEIDQDKALKIRNRINKLSDGLLRKKVRYAIMEAKLPNDILQQLIAMLILNEDEDNIRSFVDKYISDASVAEEEPVQPAAEYGEKAPRRKVIYTEETKRAKEFKGDVQNVSKYFVLIIVIAIILGALFYRLIFIPSASNRYYERGLSDLKRTDYKSAEMNFKTANDRFGPDMKWHNIFASNYILLKQYDAAKKKYSDALLYDPIDKETIYNFAKFYKTYVYPPRYDEALRLYSRLLKRSPDNFEYLDKTGTTYIEWGDRTSDPNERTKLYDEAARLYQNYLAKKPKHVDSYFRLLDITIRQKQEKQIDDLYDAIDHINPNAVNVHTMTELAKFYTDRKRLDRSKLVLNKLIAANPSYDESYFEYARFLTINYDFPRAIKSITKAIQINPKSGKSYNLLGEIYFAYDKLPNNQVLAKEQFENAIKYSPNFYKPYANLGHIYFYNNMNFPEPEKALSEAYNNYKMAEQLMDKDTKDDLLSYNLGWLNYRYKLYNEAFNNFSDIYIDDPHNPILSFNLANIYFYLNNYKLALTEYDKAIDYFQALADRIDYINPELERHKEIYGQLTKSYNNRGVVFAELANGSKNPEYEKRALLDFYKAKDNASKINSIYNYAEYNIKYILNKGIKGRQPALDNELEKRTTLKKLIEEFQEKLINSL